MEFIVLELKHGDEKAVKQAKRVRELEELMEAELQKEEQRRILKGTNITSGLTTALQTPQCRSHDPKGPKNTGQEKNSLYYCID